MDTHRLPALRVSPAAADQLSGAFSALGVGISGLVGAIIVGNLSIGYLVGGFIVGAAGGVIAATRRWRDRAEPSADYEPLPPQAVIRPVWLAPAWVALHIPIMWGGGFLICYFTQWGIVSAGAVAAFATHPFLSWAGVRKWQRENRATLYYERMPLMTGGITRRYARRSTVVASASP